MSRDFKASSSYDIAALKERGNLKEQPEMAQPVTGRGTGDGLALMQDR